MGQTPPCTRPTGDCVAFRSRVIGGLLPAGYPKLLPDNILNPGDTSHPEHQPLPASLRVMDTVVPPPPLPLTAAPPTPVIAIEDSPKRS